MDTPTAHQLPVPPSIVNAVRGRAAADHADTDMMPALSTFSGYPGETVGYGRHTCDVACSPGTFGCFGSCDDSDYVVTMQYRSTGALAVYGVLIDATGTAHVSLWMD